MHMVDHAIFLKRLLVDRHVNKLIRIRALLNSMKRSGYKNLRKRVSILKSRFKLKK